MTPRMQQVLEYVLANGEVKARDVAENYGLSQQTASLYLRSLRHMGHVKCSSMGRDATWMPETQSCVKYTSVWHFAQQ